MLSALLRAAMKCSSLFIFYSHLPCKFPGGGVGYEYVRELHSDRSSAMARYSLKLTGSPEL
jgi:hypothetical protein